MTGSKATIWCWVLLLTLDAVNTLDLVLLRRYTSPTTHETFPPLAQAICGWGIDESIWAIRFVVFSFIFGVLSLKHAYPKSLPYINYFLVALNLCYLSGMCDYPFAMKWI